MMLVLRQKRSRAGLDLWDPRHCETCPGMKDFATKTASALIYKRKGRIQEAVVTPAASAALAER